MEMDMRTGEKGHDLGPSLKGDPDIERKRNDFCSRKSPAEIVQNFVDNATTHGVTRILRCDRSRLSRLFWAVITLTALGALLYQGSMIVIDYFHRPTTTKISLITKSELIFPAITICNLNMMRKSKVNGTRFQGLVGLDALYEDIHGDDYDYDWFYETDSSFTTTSQSLNRRRRRRDVDEDEASISSEHVDYPSWDGVTDPDDWRSFYDRSQSSDFTDLQAAVRPTRDELEAYGHTGVDLIQQCSFDGDPCSHKNFSRIQNIRYGNCFVLNDGNKLKNASVIKTSRTGSQYGLHLTLLVEQPEYIGVLTPEAGVVVAIHDPSVFAFPEDDGISVSTGQATSIGLRRSYITRLEDPYGDCVDGNQEYYNPQMYNFSQRSCSKMCLEKAMLKQCKCVTDILVNGTMCSPINQTERACRTSVLKKYIRNKLSCQCENPCFETVYIPTISTLRWPTERYEEHLYTRLANKSEKAARFLLNKEHASKNLVRLKVFFQELNFERVVETPLITIESLFGSVGGLMGLYIGMSVISACEILVFIAQLVRSVCCKSNERRPNVIKVTGT
ncbi:epithelial sodium channel subunit gamma-2-like [Diadema antillarum]|uniref:epithelial sodium channel subunit gamma-2-like n=1 Tax=Diadema antillarum TaxID=105358 RepID=UPI003A87A0BF